MIEFIELVFASNPKLQIDTYLHKSIWASIVKFC